MKTLLHSEGHCIWIVRLGFNIQNIQGTQETSYKENSLGFKNWGVDLNRILKKKKTQMADKQRSVKNS